MLTLDLTEKDAASIMNALQNSVQFWLDKKSSAEPDSTLFKIASQQADSYAETLSRILAQYEGIDK